jgi:hypothetical protein
MSAELIYKTTSPDAITWWQNAAEKRREEEVLRAEFAAEMLFTYGPREQSSYDPTPPDRKLWLRGEGVVGLDAAYNERPPADSGWRLDSKERIWMPALRTPAGRILRDRLRGLTVYRLRAHLREIGVPEMTFAGSYIYRPGLEFDEPTQTLFCTWGSGMCATAAVTEQAKVPAIVWEEVPRSVWYAREETKQVADV